MILVPMDIHTEGLHGGHHALIDIARDMGEVVVPLSESADDYAWYLWHGKKKPSRGRLPHKMQEELASRGCRCYMKDEIVLDDVRRKEWKKKAIGLLESYKDFIPDPQEQRRLFSMWMGWRGFPAARPFAGKVEAIVRGPEIHGWFHRSINKLLGGPPVEIMKKIYKHKATKIKLQSRIQDYPVYCEDELYNIRRRIDGWRVHYKVGNNLELLRKLQHDYKHKPWTVMEIHVYEGPVVEGRLEVTKINFPSRSADSPIVRVEEVDYEC